MIYTEEENQEYTKLVLEFLKCVDKGLDDVFL